MIVLQDPFLGLTEMDLVPMVTRGERPPIPAGCPPAYEALIRRCWASDPKDRPTAASVLKDLVEHARDIVTVDIPDAHTSVITATSFPMK